MAWSSRHTSQHSFGVDTAISSQGWTQVEEKITQWIESAGIFASTRDIWRSTVLRTRGDKRVGSSHTLASRGDILCSLFAARRVLQKIQAVDTKKGSLSLY